MAREPVRRPTRSFLRRHAWKLAALPWVIAAGLANAPSLITGNTLVPLVVPAPNLTEAYTWLGVSVFAGIAVGSALVRLKVAEEKASERASGER